MPSISPDLKVWLDLIQWLLMLALSVSVWLRKPGEDAGKAVQLLRAEVTGKQQLVDKAIATIEEQIRHMPTSEELAKLEGSVNSISAKVGGIADAMGVQNQQLNRIETYLLQSR